MVWWRTIVHCLVARQQSNNFLDFYIHCMYFNHTRIATYIYIQLQIPSKNYYKTFPHKMTQLSHLMVEKTYSGVSDLGQSKLTSYFIFKTDPI